ncbi:MAG: hypothetical protein ACFFER_15100 [Candidatus Thorarchaeota archaeon]
METISLIKPKTSPVSVFRKIADDALQAIHLASADALIVSEVLVMLVTKFQLYLDSLIRIYNSCGVH